MKTALITGVAGQDGAYLSRLLLGKGYRVFGTHRPKGHVGFHRLRELGVAAQVEPIAMDLTDLANIHHVLEETKPDEVYNLAAQSFVGASFEDPLSTAEANANGCLRLLEAIRLQKPDARFYQASSSDMFGQAGSDPQRETTAFRPRSPYGITKLFAHWMTVGYREAHSLFACSGILFNHESPLRSLDFVTRKISHAVAAIKLGSQVPLHLGNLDAKRDWGYAAEYVEAMWLMLQQAQADDYVVATGQAHTVREFADSAFRAAGINVAWVGRSLQEKGRDAQTGKIVAEVSEELIRPAEADLSVGDATKARTILGWTPRTRFDELVRMMVESDLTRSAKQV